MPKKVNNSLNFLSTIEKGAILLSIILLISSLTMPVFFVDRGGTQPEEVGSSDIF
jgi:hypothetical protein